MPPTAPGGYAHAVIPDCAREGPVIAEDDQTAARIRPAEAPDIDALLTVEQQCFNVYYYAYYMLNRRNFEFCLEDADSLFLVAVVQEQVVGYVLGPVEPWREPPAAHIDSIAVLPEMQNRGLGSRLLQSFMSEASRAGCKLVTLEVAAANEAGLAFFARHGFRKLRRLRNYYGKDLHGLLMAAPAEEPSGTLP